MAPANQMPRHVGLAKMKLKRVGSYACEARDPSGMCESATGGIIRKLLNGSLDRLNSSMGEANEMAALSNFI
jgi:hypothetical protein